MSGEISGLDEERIKTDMASNVGSGQGSDIPFVADVVFGSQEWKPSDEEVLKILNGLDEKTEGNSKWEYDDENEDQTDVDVQSRPGTHHGRGGRRRRPNAEDMVQIERKQIDFVIMNTLLNCCGGLSEDISTVVSRLWRYVRQSRRAAGEVVTDNIS